MVLTSAPRERKPRQPDASGSMLCIPARISASVSCIPQTSSISPSKTSRQRPRQQGARSKDANVHITSAGANSRPLETSNVALSISKLDHRELRADDHAARPEKRREAVGHKLVHTIAGVLPVASVSRRPVRSATPYRPAIARPYENAIAPWAQAGLFRNRPGRETTSERRNLRTTDGKQATWLAMLVSYQARPKPLAAQQEGSRD
ncbi:hypothetical protein C8Q80DRAFT_707864 [Daedaleopsis nitida]|nr:hypothetical protein C8Q80DRAFT_707864 [Daedaleopsis nitida]